MNPLWTSPTRKNAKIRLKLVSEMLLPRLNLEEKERTVPPMKRTKARANTSPTTIQITMALVKRPFTQYLTRVAMVLKLFKRSVLHGALRLRRLGRELEEDLVEPGVLPRIGHPAEAVERS